MGSALRLVPSGRDGLTVNAKYGGELSPHLDMGNFVAVSDRVDSLKPIGKLLSA